MTFIPAPQPECAHAPDQNTRGEQLRRLLADQMRLPAGRRCRCPVCRLLKEHPELLTETELSA